MQATNQGRTDLDMRVYLTDMDTDLHDILGKQAEYALVYHDDDYSAGQHLARVLRLANSNGIAYSSVRRAGGECVAIFRPRVLSNCRQERHLSYVWDGRRISNVYEKRALSTGSTDT
jgi:hypothetical protein